MWVEVSISDSAERKSPGEAASAGQATSAATAPGIAPVWFACTVFASAALVFLVEPLIGKLVLPILGGSPAVWNTCLAFFQAALLVGYGYAHVLQRIGSLRHQAILHAVVLLITAAFLPLRVSQLLGEPGNLPPVVWLVGVLALSVGPPFIALSATAPLVQAWYARLRRGEADANNPYVLYAASNLGSLLALLSYPVIVEPILRLKTQTLSWSLGYASLVVLMVWLARAAWSVRKLAVVDAAQATAISPRPPLSERLLWVGLAAMPSSLMLGVTSFITMDVGSAPFLWVAPLALYLLTFIIAFQRLPLITQPHALLWQAAGVVACLFSISLSLPAVAKILLHLTGFFFTALVCHQALAARRPAPDRLTEFYLFMSLGGVIGGSFNVFVAPLIFNTVAEYPIVLVLAALARPWGQGGLARGQWGLLIAGLCAAGAALFLPKSQGLLLMAIPLVAAFLLRDRAWAFGALSAALILCSHQLTNRSNLVKIERGFFGVLELERINLPMLGNTRFLVHGTTLHGAQADDPARRCQPLLYYATTTPIGQVFTSLQDRKPSLRFGAIGMGAGTVAAYTRATDSLRFFEIDPLVIGMATDPAYFTYINGCARGQIDWVVGDARLTLAREPQDEFDLLLVDAFSSDSVPAHLLTVEAMRGYLARIKPDGVIIMHLSNRNLELMSPVAGVALAAGGAALQQVYFASKDVRAGDSDEDAIIVARNPAALAPYMNDPHWTPAQSHGVRVWTDDYSNLFGALIRRLEKPGRQ